MWAQMQVAKENRCRVAVMKLLKITAWHSITDRRRKFITQEKMRVVVLKLVVSNLTLK